MIPVATASQWALLGGNLALLLLAFIVGWRWPRLRPLAFAVGSLAFTHALYYVLFLILPDVLGFQETMNFSIAIKFQVLFGAILVLALGVKKELR